MKWLNDHTYEIIDEETGMSIVVEGNTEISEEESENIKLEVLKILARQDI